jgi:hypothetical protein
MPVNTLTADDGSIQWTVQNEAVDGGIHNIVITSGGSGYTNASNLVVSVSGDGSGFTATANINATSQTVSTITITNPGLNYTFGTVSITGGGGTGATGRAIMSPPGGHGSDALYELGGSRLIVSVKVRGSEDGILPVTNDLRQIALVKDPYLNETTTIASNNAFFQGHTIVVTGSGDYIDDEFIYQGTSLAAATYRARVLEWDSANGIIKATETLGEPSAASLLGATSATTRFVSSFEKEDLEPHSGQLLYIDNIKPITRAADQTENYKIVLKF